MQNGGFLVLRTGAEWWVAVLNSKPPTGTNLYAKSSVAGQKPPPQPPPPKKKEHCGSKREGVCIPKGLKGKARKEMGTCACVSEPWRRQKVTIASDSGVNAQGCDPPFV